MFHTRFREYSVIRGGLLGSLECCYRSAGLLLQFFWESTEGSGFSRDAKLTVLERYGLGFCGGSFFQRSRGLVE